MQKSSFKIWTFAILGIAIGALSFVQPADAALFSKTYTGQVTAAEAGNPFGLAAGSVISTSVTYDSAALTGIGEEFIELDSSSAFGLDISLGLLAFHASDDGLFGSGFPKLGFLDGRLMSIDFLVDFGFGDYTDLTLLVFESLEIIDNTDFDRVLVAGDLGIPEPGTLILFAGAIAGLIVTRRKRV